MGTDEERGALVARIEALERRCRSFARMLAAAGACVAVALLAQFGGVARAGQDSAAAAARSTVGESLTLRELVIVDARGTPRVRIAAPLPEPLMLGKRFKRGDAVSGILIYDGEGNERGGYVTGDVSRDAALTLDEINRAAIHIGVSERGEAHVMLGNGQGSSAAMGVVPDGGFLRLESGGKAVATLPAAAEAGK